MAVVLQLLLEDAVLPEAGSVLDCLKPMALHDPSGDVTHEYQAATRPSGGGEVLLEKMNGGQGSLNSGTRGRRDSILSEEEQILREEAEKVLPTMHTCWVKAGHDALHERGAFMRGLLHKVRSWWPVPARATWNATKRSSQHVASKHTARKHTQPVIRP